MVPAGVRVGWSGVMLGRVGCCGAGYGGMLRSGVGRGLGWCGVRVGLGWAAVGRVLSGWVELWLGWGECREVLCVQLLLAISYSSLDCKSPAGA